MLAVKSDNAADIGVHAFEQAGLGMAPFRVVGFHTAKYQACQGAPIQPGASCAFCGTGIMECFVIKGASKTTAGNDTFVVGSDCVKRTGDAGLIRGYKAHPDYRRAQQAKRYAKDDANVAQWKEWMADADVVAKLTAFQHPTHIQNVSRPWIEYARNSWNWSGMSGRAKLVAAVRKILAGEA